MRQVLLARYRQWLVAGIATIILVTFTGLVVQAQGGYPEPTGLYINDFAGLLNARDKANVEALFTGLKQVHGIEATVVTIDSISDYNTGDATIESFATSLFNTWGIGDKEKNNGILLLVAVGDREVRIEVGSGYENSQNANMKEVINEHILPSFRSGNFSQGIYRGSRAIVGKLTGDWPPDLSATTSSSTQPTTPTQSRPIQSNPVESTYNSIVNDLADISPIIYIGGGLIALWAGNLGGRRYLRYRKRRCPNCQTYMVRLDEVSDDMYLDSGQKAEELLKSIDYDVWKCSNCNTHTMQGYRNWFTSLKKCPKCGYRTSKVTSETVVQPTYTSSGSKRITRDCRHCGYQSQEFVILPKLTEPSDDNSSFGSSSSSDSDSFSGGSSSGGGASGKW